MIKLLLWYLVASAYVTLIVCLRPFYPRFANGLIVGSYFALIIGVIYALTHSV